MVRARRPQPNESSKSFGRDIDSAMATSGGDAWPLANVRDAVSSPVETTRNADTGTACDDRKSKAGTRTGKGQHADIVK